MDNQTGFASGYNQTLIHTDNGGGTWSAVEISSDSGLIYSSLGCGVTVSILSQILVRSIAQVIQVLAVPSIITLIGMDFLT